MKLSLSSVLYKLFRIRIIYPGNQPLDPGLDTNWIHTVDFSRKVFDQQEEALPTVRQCAAYSMASIQRMLVLFNLCRHLEKTGLEGDLVECGVWKGGNSGIMAGANLKYGKNRRRLWLYDSFEGLPAPVERDGADAIQYSGGKSDGSLKTVEQCVADEQYVLELLEALQYPRDKVEVVKGWFQDTLPTRKPDSIAVLRLDGDWYESTKVCLDHLFDRVVPGGVVFIDDYGAWKGCRDAVDEFLVARGLTPFLHHVDCTARYWHKSA